MTGFFIGMFIGAIIGYIWHIIWVEKLAKPKRRVVTTMKTEKTIQEIEFGILLGLLIVFIAGVLV